MTTNADPWRTLGLKPGASLEDVRRAYRRLAKANHPDAAGETALPRFLAIQAAYEQILGPMARRRPGSRPGSRPASPAEPSQADADRARASGRADGRRPGARPTGAGAGTSTAGGSASGGGGRASSDSAGGQSSGRQRRTSSRRSPNKRTPYSTSYDAADEEPFEPGWTGATWYGASSGTYWTINPREYADPRKHGPEYQRRARRGANGWILDDDANGPDEAGPVAEAADTGAAGSAADEAARASAARAARAEPESAHSDGPAAGSHEQPPAAARPTETSWTDARAWSTGAATTAGAHQASPSSPDATAGPPPRARPRAGVDEPPADRPFRGPVLRQPTTAGGRLAIALLGWPPLALVASVGIGEETGCGRFAASCSELSSPGTWIVMAALLVLLLALPRVAVWAAHGTIATLLVGIPTAIVLSAGGGSRQQETSSTVLLTVIVLAWVAGIVYAIVVPRLGGSVAAYHGPDEPPSRQQ